jgi:CRISPR-associated endonuclease Csn1
VKNRKNEQRFVFSPVTVRVASKGIVELEQYAAAEAEVNGEKFIRIIRNKIYKYQLIEIGTDQFYITGKKEVRNARQLAFSLEETELFQKLEKGLVSEKMNLDESLILLQRMFLKQAPKLERALNLNSVNDRFSALTQEEKARILCSLVSIAAAKTNMIDMSLVGGGSKVGCMQLTFNKLLNDQKGISVIDQSVTGMFERRTHIGL